VSRRSAVRAARGRIRIAAGVLAAVVLAAGVSACSAGGEDELVTLDRVGRADAPKVLKLQVNADFSPQASVPSHAAGFRRLFAEWARNHPEWRLDLTIVPGAFGTQEQARLLIRAKAGEGPDCANVDSFTIPLFIQQGVLQPIDRHFSREEVRDLLPYVRDVVTGPDERIYAWWWATDLRVLYRRTDLVPEAPRTWDELIAAGKAAKRKDPGVDGYLFNGSRWEATVFDNLAYFWMQGGKLLDERGRPVFAEGENRKRMLNVLRLLRRTIDEGVAPERVVAIGSYDEFQTAAEAKSVAMFLGISPDWPGIQEALGEEEGAKWAVSAVPGHVPGETATGTGGWTMGAFSNDPEKIAACMSLTREVYVGEGNTLTGQLPTQRRLFELEAFREPIYQQFRRLLRDGTPRPGLAIYPELSNQLQIAIGSVLTGSATPEAALDAARERVNQAYELQAGI